MNYNLEILRQRFVPKEDNFFSLLSIIGPKVYAMYKSYLSLTSLNMKTHSHFFAKKTLDRSPQSLMQTSNDK